MSSQEIGKRSWRNPEVAASLAGYVPEEDPVLEALIKKAREEPNNVAARVALERYAESKGPSEAPGKSKIGAIVTRITGRKKAS